MWKFDLRTVYIFETYNVLVMGMALISLPTFFDTGIHTIKYSLVMKHVPSEILNQIQLQDFLHMNCRFSPFLVN